MEWLNLHTSVLDSSAFIGSEPSARATWLCLLRYCIGQENGGKITGARTWGDRKWQQLVRVTLKEVQAESDLWTWDADSITVYMYPSDKEDEVRTRRENARKNGMAGGRPRLTNVATDVITHDKPTLVNSGKAEGNGMEGEWKENGMEVEKKVRRRSPVGSPTDDKEWLVQLAANPAYQGIDVAREHAKMTVWAATRNVKATRRRFVNWLNRCEKPLTGGFKDDSEAAKTLKYTY